MKKITKVFGLTLLAATLAACSGGIETGTIPSDNPYFPGKTHKWEYNSLIGTAITDLNYLGTQAGASAQHFANFEDGLLLHNSFGSLEKQLATKVEQTNSYQEFTIDIRAGVPWVTYTGEQYSAMIEGKATPQFVSADDFVTSAKAVLTQPNGSETAYLLYTFIEGAAPYYQATYLMDKIANGGSTWAQYKDDAKFAKKLNTLVTELIGGESPEYEAADVADIKNFSRVGVKTITAPGEQGGGKLKYTLMNPASYFPTLLTYSCYLPVNEHFLKDVRYSRFGSAPDKLLYNGPFRLTASSETLITYERNESYWGIDKVHLKKINYRVYPADASYNYTRQEFEEGRIDGFTINSKDKEGWNKYIKGPDGTGTILNPYDDYVNSRDYDTIDYVYGLNINVNRASNSTNGKTAIKSYASATDYNASNTSVKNTEKALYIQEVRDLILASYDYGEYVKRYNDDPEYQAQYMINTYVPRGFVIDDNGNDYTKTHYYEEWGKHNLDRVAQDNDPTKVDLNKVDKIIGQGQYDGVQVAYNDLAPLRAKANAAIDLYNDGKAQKDQISKPINLEFFTVWTDAESKIVDEPLIASLNRRLNGMPTTTDFSDPAAQSQMTFYVIPTSEANTSNYETISHGGNFDISCIWGWGPDYGDPMSYLNTFAVGGDWSSIFGFVGSDTINYRMNAAEDALVKEDSLLGEYTDLVKAGNREYEDINERFDIFAEAEYKLINELAIFKPLTMQGQGRQVSISFAVGYESPSGSYGLSSSRLDGLWVLVDKLLRTERQAVIAKYDASKAAYLAEHGAINIY